MKLNSKPLADIETGFPILAEGPYFVVIENAEAKPNKAGTGHNMNITLKVLNPQVTKYGTGELVENNGLKLFYQFSLVPTDKWDPDTKIRQIADAIGHPLDEDLELHHLKGKQCKAIVKYRAAEGQYPEKCEVTRLAEIDETEQAPA